MKNVLLFLVLALTATGPFAQKDPVKAQLKSKPFVLGIVDEIRSEELGENRVLNIYLPEGYNPNDTLTYPVIYLLDGSANEDFIHIVGLVQFNNFEWIDRVPKSIVVGIATVDRERDFTFPTQDAAQKKRFPTTGHSDKFMAFIEKELQPYMQSAYRVNEDKTLIGQSLGGLLATEILLEKPKLFNRYIIVSPSLWWDNGSLLEQSTEKLAATRTDVYIGVGKEGLTPTTVPRVMEVDANLLADKLKALENEQVRVTFDYLPAENHATILHQAVSNAFQLLYAGPEHRD